MINQNKQPDKLLFTVRETASMLSISERSLWSLTNEGKIQSVRVGKKSVRYFRDDIEKFIDENKAIQTN